jgi:hypothetical protein
VRLFSEADGFIIDGIIWTKDIIGLLVVLQLQVEILHNLVGCFHLFMINCYLLIQLGLNVDKRLYLSYILSSAWPY